MIQRLTCEHFYLHFQGISKLNLRNDHYEFAKTYHYSKRHQCDPPKHLNSTVATSRFSTNLDTTGHAATKVLDNVWKVADGVAMGNEIPSTSTVAVVVEP